ncbi:hypothetical protein TNCV_1652271 [Trichonephila clavipes]|nr:hypothetical protein TNCV_1652271 [Trichonephila clavipes]
MPLSFPYGCRLPGKRRVSWWWIMGRLFKEEKQRKGENNKVKRKSLPNQNSTNCSGVEVWRVEFQPWFCPRHMTFAQYYEIRLQ